MERRMALAGMAHGPTEAELEEEAAKVRRRPRPAARRRV